MSDHTIETRAVCKEYGAVRAVEGVSTQVPQGQVVSLLGPNGAGKSTLIDLILGLTSPDAGEVRISGMSPADAVRTGTIGAMLQSTALLGDATVSELVGMVTCLHRHPLGSRRHCSGPGSPTSRAVVPRGCQGANASASPTPSRSPGTPTSSCSTNRRPRWTSPRGTPSGRRYGR